MIILTAISCSKDKDGSGGNGPSISSISPSSALTGGTITITGKNLAASTVTIGGISVNVSDNTSTSITTWIPNTPIGQQEVLVTNLMGTAKSTISVTGIGAGPVITSIAPADAAIGQTITITGTGLADAVVEIATKVSTINTNTATSITVVVPANIAMGAASVRVTTSLGTEVSNMNIIP